MIETLQRWSAERGYRVAWGPAAVVNIVRREILELRATGALDTNLFDSELAGVAAGPEYGPEQSVVIVAKPDPAYLVSFDLGHERFDALLPPTYFRYRPIFEDVRQDLERHGLPGVQLDHLTAPLKTIAARLGLVRYGRNNVTYVPELGSYLQLCGYVAGAALPERPIAERGELLPDCESCELCVSVCPTGAIDPDRTLIHAERCLTFANETLDAAIRDSKGAAGEGAWPSWVPAWAHNCLLGCLECQRACPANPPLPIGHSGLRFSAEETRALLAKPAPENPRVEDGIRLKLAWLGQPYSEPVLGRNLLALLQARAQTP
jgi:epoxyqueuosine reductase